MLIKLTDIAEGDIDSDGIAVLVDFRGHDILHYPEFTGDFPGAAGVDMGLLQLLQSRRAEVTEYYRGISQVTVFLRKLADFILSQQPAGPGVVKLVQYYPCTAAESIKYQYGVIVEGCIFKQVLIVAGRLLLLRYSFVAHTRTLFS